MRPRRPFLASAIAAAAALASVLLAAQPVAVLAQESNAGPACEAGLEIAFLPSPVAPWKGAPLRVLMTAEKPFDGELSLVGPDGRVAASSKQRMGGPPYFWLAEVAQPAAGKWNARLTREGAPSGCGEINREVVVRPTAPPRPGSVAGSVWPVRASWNRANEDLYSAWIEKLFDAPLEAELSWPALHEVLRDKQRNILFNHLGLGEDQMGMIVRPDCADLPYFLRAYFAFKTGLPFGYAKCTRGRNGQPPKCTEWWNVQNEDPRKPFEEEQTVQAKQQQVRYNWLGMPIAALPPPAQKTLLVTPPRVPQRPVGLAPAFGHYLKYSIAEGVHSGSGRLPANAESSDYYPVPLTADHLRPGTVYADPYGHLLVIAKRIPQTGSTAGVLLAVDAQPDGTVARKRFWRGNFLFAQEAALGNPGFKRFRPIMREGNRLRRLTNAEIGRDRNYADFSLDQSKLSIEAFYDRMEDVLSPAPLDPMRAMKEAITALEEQVRARVTSVENGRKYQLTGRGEASMPDGAAIFETTGAWEDFATPSRDLRLLIAIDVVRHFPDRVARRPERYAMPAGKSVADVKAELAAVLDTELSGRSFSYPRTDGSPWKLTVKDVVARVRLLEMAYNVNDCVELRWGAEEGSAEASTCKRRAPAAQRAKMTDYRAWFQERRRPPRA